jgi:phosphinothricin acetyltransferase
MLIRDSRDDDLDAVTRLYRHHVLQGTGTFETEPPSVNEMTARRADVLRKGLPWLVLDDGSSVVGFAYANWFRPRAAFRYAVEDSIYLAPEVAGRGLGRALLAELLARCEAAGMRKAIAVIGDSANGGSIGLHRALGFVHTGTVASCGWKFGRWLDIVLMEKSLGLGESCPPQAQ